MKYYVNKKTMTIGSDDKTYSLGLESKPDWMDENIAGRLNTIVLENFHADLHTIQYDDQTDTCLEIDLKGKNYLSTIEENPAIQTIIDIFVGLVDQEESVNDKL